MNVQCIFIKYLDFICYTEFQENISYIVWIIIHYQYYILYRYIKLIFRQRCHIIIVILRVVCCRFGIENSNESYQLCLAQMSSTNISAPYNIYL